MFTKVFSLLALLGFLMSLLVNILAVAGVSAHEYDSLTWLLHLGIFVVFVPALLISRKSKEKSDPWSNLPRTLAVFSSVLFAYTSFNLVNYFSSSTVLERAKWSVSSGNPPVYTLTKNGESHVSTREQYMRDQALQDRSFSSIWMVFYLGSFGMLRGAIKREKIDYNQPPVSR